MTNQVVSHGFRGMRNWEDEFDRRAFRQAFGGRNQIMNQSFEIRALRDIRGSILSVELGA